MFRSITRLLVVTVVLITPAAALASDKTDPELLAPSKAVADAWAKEARRNSSSKAVTALQLSYSGLQAMDMWTTIVARDDGAREVNPLMRGGYVSGAVFKAAMGAGTIAATRAMARKSRKAAIVTMIVLNGVTAAVVANNVRNARR